MSKKQSGAVLTLVSVDKQSKVQLFRQLETQLRNAILAGSLTGGTRLPSSRALASELGVSRPTVVLVLERLAGEGFLEARHGAGTFVASVMPQHLPRTMQVPQANQPSVGAFRPETGTFKLSRTGARFAAIKANIEVSDRRPFLPNAPAYDKFPFALWQTCANRRARQSFQSGMGYTDPAGYAPLKRAIADYLALHRGDHCDPEQIVITPGGHAAFMIAALLLTDPGDRLLFEDPGPVITRNLFESLDRKIVHTPVDDDGMDFEQIVQKVPRLRMAFTMPSRHHPLGKTLSLARRFRLMDWAQANDAWIIEDDYDSEFRYTGRPLPSMRSIDKSGRVLYVGTFSKALFPALRVGYFVLPPALVPVFRNAMALMFRSVPLTTQMVLADFIAEGHFSTHLRRMRELYTHRRRDFIETAAEVSEGNFEIDSPDSGMNAIAWLPKGVSDTQVHAKAVERGIHCYPLSDYCARPYQRDALVLGFTSVQSHQLRPGLEALSQLISAERRGL
tara:strand:- start:5512 stop:7026 length:1515 start_codon:yes stop_codon:yes gene_type:complete